MKKSLAISLKREIHYYGSPIVRQGQAVENLYIITEGEVEILIDQGGYKEQFPEMWTEMKRLLPELLPPKRRVSIGRQRYKLV
uniref:Cyclic nucleotide-binding domain-containing protein n=1 Tax=Magallana gigas TaxID=29159 RepID=A0A8W8IWQ3_MAGGI